MNNQPPAGRAFDTVIAAALTIPAAEWRAICLVDDHEHGAMWCYQCHGLVAAQPRVPERYSTDIAASEQLVVAMHARGYICQEWSSENVYACVSSVYLLIKKACTTIDMQQHMVYYQWEP